MDLWPHSLDVLVFELKMVHNLAPNKTAKVARNK